MRTKVFFGFLGIIILSSIAIAEKGSLKVGAFPAPPQLSASVKFVEPSGNNILDAGETGKLIVTVQNTGKGDAFDVKGQLKTNKQIAGLSFSREVAIGTILSGKTVTIEIPVQAGEDIPTDSVSFDIEVKEANGFDATPLKLSFKTRAFEPPKLVIADIGINDQNKNSWVEPLENVELTARIQNVGYGDARGVSVDIQSGQNVFIGGDGKTRFDLGSIQAGKFKDVTFMFYTNNRIKDGEKIPLSIQINEARPRFSTNQPLTLAMNAPQKSVEEIVVKGEDTEKRPDITLAGGLSVDVDMHIPEGEKAGRYDIAVIIGNKNYKNIPNVEYADRDAVIMKVYLTEHVPYMAQRLKGTEQQPVIMGNDNDVMVVLKKQ